jgi:hypothetical protein
MRQASRGGQTIQLIATIQDIVDGLSHDVVDALQIVI